MASSPRLMGYLRAIKALTDDQYSRVWSAVVNAFWLNVPRDATSTRRRQTTIQTNLPKTATGSVELFLQGLK